VSVWPGQSEPSVDLGVAARSKFARARVVRVLTALLLGALALGGAAGRADAVVDPVMVTPVTQSPAANADTGLNPVSVAFSPGGGLLATSNVEDDTISMFSVNDVTGALTPVGTPEAAGAFPWGVAFSPDGGLLADANSTYGCAPTCYNGSVSTFQVGATGALTPASTVDAGMQPQSVTFTPNGLFLATANVYSNSVSVFGVDDTTGALTPVTQSPATNADTGKYPFDAAFSPGGGLLAVANDGSNTVSMFAVNEMTGALTPVTQSPATNADTGMTPWSVAFSPNGGLLAVANSASSAVSIFQVNDATGALTPVTQSPASNADTGDSQGVAFGAGGALLATADTVSGIVSLFQVNDATGALTPDPQSPASNADTGAFPYSLAFSPNGGLIATANFDANTVSMFTLSGSTATGTGSETGTGTGTGGTSGSGSGSGSTGTAGAGGGSAPTSTGTSGAGLAALPIASLSAQLGLPSTKACVSQRKLTIHVAEHVVQSTGANEIKSAEVLLAGRVVAKLKGPVLVAHVSLAGLKKGSFKITVKATTTAGKTLTASSTFHTCSSAKRKRK